MSTYDPYLTQRRDMVDKQIRKRGIKDDRVLRAMEEVPRHLFVDKAFVGRAYDDGPLPIAERQTISQPYIVALMVESLGLTGDEKVLEIGSGSGYQTAVLSKLADRVLSIERSPKLGRRAEKLLFDLGHHNTLIRIADGTYGWIEEAPYDAIIVSAAAPSVPDQYADQLKFGGVLVIPIGNENDQILYRFVKTKNDFEKVKLCACRFVKLIGRYGFPNGG
jgi:protein-L-isoaspartate(D-aspartate) O-methyltransferase